MYSCIADHGLRWTAEVQVSMDVCVLITLRHNRRQKAVFLGTAPLHMVFLGRS